MSRHRRRTPLLHRLRPEGAQRATGDQVALDVEGVVNGLGAQITVRGFGEARAGPGRAGSIGSAPVVRMTDALQGQ